MEIYISFRHPLSFYLPSTFSTHSHDHSGPPGAGKGTVANKLSESESESGSGGGSESGREGKGYAHLSTGELLRKERETNQFIKDNWSYAMLEDIAFKLLEKEIERSEYDVILDGCPKTVSDAKKVC